MKVDLSKRCAQLVWNLAPGTDGPTNRVRVALTRSDPAPDTYAAELFCLEHAQRDDVILETGHKI